MKLHASPYSALLTKLYLCCDCLHCLVITVISVMHVMPPDITQLPQLSWKNMP